MSSRLGTAMCPVNLWSQRWSRGAHGVEISIQISLTTLNYIQTLRLIAEVFVFSTHVTLVANNLKLCLLHNKPQDAHECLGSNMCGLQGFNLQIRSVG